MRGVLFVVVVLAGCGAPAAPVQDEPDQPVEEPHRDPTRRGVRDADMREVWWNGTLHFQVNHARTPVFGLVVSGLLGLTPGNCAYFPADTIHAGTAVATWPAAALELEIGVAGETSRRITGPSPLQLDLAGVLGDSRLRFFAQSANPGASVAQDVELDVSMRFNGIAEPEYGTCAL